MTTSENMQAGGSPLMHLVQKLFTSSSIRNALGFTLGGLAFSLANLLLARYLTTIDYALLSLMLALKEFGLGVGPWGLDVVINRNRLQADRRLLVHLIISSFATAALLSYISQPLYELSGEFTLILAVLVLGSTFTRVASTLFQSRLRFGPALSLTQIHNFVLLAAVPLALYLDQLDARFVLLVVTASYLLTGIAGWLGASRIAPEVPQIQLSSREILIEGFYGLGLGAAVLIMMQAERLVIPIYLDLETLAIFGVLSTVVAAPFRMLQLGISYTVLPRISASTSLSETMTILREESRISLVLCLVATLGVYFLGPPIIEYFVGEKYVITSGMLIAAIIVGYAKIWQGIATSSATAVCSRSELGILNAVGWVGLVVALTACWLLKAHGLVGMIYGVGTGWAFYAMAATIMTSRSLVRRHDTGELQPP